MRKIGVLRKSVEHNTNMWISFYIYQIFKLCEKHLTIFSLFYGLIHSHFDESFIRPNSLFFYISYIIKQGNKRMGRAEWDQNRIMERGYTISCRR